MKKFVLALTFTVLLGNARTLADTQTFNAYGAAMLPEQGASMNIAPSVAFPGFTLYTTGLVQLDSPELDGATNYELLGNQGDLTIAFTVPQNSFSISLRDFKYLPGGAPAGGLETITVFGADHTTVLSTYVVGLNRSIITSTNSSESAPIGAVNLSEISGEFWTGLLQSVSFSTPDPTPEPASLSLLGIGVLALAGMVRRKLIP
jgi:PEP-CTERM motif-containing protein